MRYRLLLFFLIFATVFLSVDLLGQVIGFLPKRSFPSTLFQTVVVGVATTVFFTVWAKRRPGSRVK
ncbi:MAG TPA: hypothetical protein VN616_17375 [Puia sp.]|nr:hypothetical protein [Puia sp.]